MVPQQLDWLVQQSVPVLPPSRAPADTSTEPLDVAGISSPYDPVTGDWRQPTSEPMRLEPVTPAQWGGAGYDASPPIKSSPALVGDRWFRSPGTDFQATITGTVSQAAGLLWITPFINRMPLVVTTVAARSPVAGGVGKYVRFLIYRILPSGDPASVLWQSADIDQGSGAATHQSACRVFLPAGIWGIGLVTDAASGDFSALDADDLRQLGGDQSTSTDSATHRRYSTSFVGLAGTDLSYPPTPTFRTEAPPLVALRAEMVDPGR